MFAGENKSQAFFGEGSESGSLLSSEFLRALEKVIGDFDGRLHDMATHTNPHGRPYQGVCRPFYFGGGATFVTAGALVDSAPGVRLGGVPVLRVSGIADVPESIPGVLEGGGVAGVPAGGMAAGDVWWVCPKVFWNALLRRL